MYELFNARLVLFPFGMNCNPDGSWTLFNRSHKPLGTIYGENLRLAVRAGRFDVSRESYDRRSLDGSEVIYFYPIIPLTHLKQIMNSRL